MNDILVHAVPQVRKRHLAFALIPGSLFLSYFVFLSFRESGPAAIFTLFDDAMISMAYAQTLVDTGSLVWFEGAPKVQGYTNLLWTLWMAGIHFVGFTGSAANLAVTVSGGVLLILSGFLVGLILRQALSAYRLCNPACIAGAGLTPFIYPLAFWTLRGFETGLLTFITLALILILIKPSEVGRFKVALVVVLVVAGILTRADFFVVCVAAAVWFRFLRRPLGQTRFDRLLLLSAVSALILIAISQKLYYGDFLPNTFALKTSGYPLGTRLLVGLVTSAKVLPGVLLLLWSGVVCSRYSTDDRPQRLVSLLITLSLSLLAYSIWVGGDAWEQWGLVNRFVTPGLALILMAVLVAATLTLSGNSERRFRGTAELWILAGFWLSLISAGVVTNPIAFDWQRALAVMIPSIPLLLGWVALSSRRLHGFAVNAIALVMVPLVFLVSVSVVPILLVNGNPVNLFVYGRSVSAGPLIQADVEATILSQRLSTLAKEKATIATVLGGSPAYYSKRKMIDLLGKSDRFVARSAPRLSPSVVPGMRAGEREFNAFLPGHNKWDYDYSIGELRPDLVLSLWWHDEADVDQMQKWGYIRGCLEGGESFWILKDSVHIDRDVWSIC